MNTLVRERVCLPIPDAKEEVMVEIPVRYSVVVPVYNEEAVLTATYQRVKAVMEQMRQPYELVFVDDGSTDATQAILGALCAEDRTVRLIRFSRNFGHQVAISAGMDYAAGDAVIVIDADLQDPPELIPAMAEKWQQGYEVVFARRTQRQGETLFKRVSAAAFYRMLRALTDVDIPLDAGDFRLLDRSVCEVMRSFHEQNRFVRGLVSWSGFRQTAVDYVRDPRVAGETKYSLRRMLKLSMDAVTSFSDKPLRLSAYAGIILLVASLFFLLYAAAALIFARQPVSGIAVVIGMLALFQSLVLVALGLMGQYVARIFDEARARPLYVVASRAGFAKGAWAHGERDC